MQYKSPTKATQENMLKKLQPLGFQPTNRPCFFVHNNIPYSIDCSAYDPEEIVNIIIRKVFNSGVNAGIQDTQQRLQQVLGIA